MALFNAASTISTPQRGATLAELADKACVGREAARRTVDHMKRAGALQIVGQRRVEYRNRPVAEYAPAVMAGQRLAQGWVQLGACLSGWVR